MDIVDLFFDMGSMLMDTFRSASDWFTQTLITLPGGLDLKNWLLAQMNGLEYDLYRDPVEVSVLWLIMGPGLVTFLSFVIAKWVGKLGFKIKNI